MENTDLTQLPDTAHYYMECSNKGTCDRTGGDCVCFDGYEGVACQRTVCPNSCSGHGTCLTKSQLAQHDYGNSYNLWDKNVAMGCLCDPGFSGPDCSLKVCKSGIDPLYLDDSATVKYPVFNFAVLTTAQSQASNFTDGAGAVGYFAIRFFDAYGEDWLTESIPAGSNCATIISALEGLPNKVVPAGTVICDKSSKDKTSGSLWKDFEQHDEMNNKRRFYVNYNLSIWDSLEPLGYGSPSPYDSNLKLPGSILKQATSQVSGSIYRVIFSGNPGAIRQPEIEIYLDGPLEPTLITKTGFKVITSVWTDGQQGESDDYFADHCDNVFVQVITKAGVTYLTGFNSAAEKNTLKTCLGGSDFESGNNVDVYNWDHGNRLYPHMIKLVRAVTSSLDGSNYAAIYFNPLDVSDTTGGGGGTFILLNPFHALDSLTTDSYEIYTTKGTLALTSNFSDIAVSFGSQFFYAKNLTLDSSLAAAEVKYSGDLSCENPSYRVNHCLNKEDMFTFLNFEKPANNPPFINLYKAKSLFKEKYSWSKSDVTQLLTGGDSTQLEFMTHVIKTDLSSNWGVANYESGTDNTFRVYKFYPDISSTYNYVNECSNRGLCSRDTGLCTCFPGYTHDDCSIQDSLAA